MAKRKTAPTDASHQHQYTSTSESVKMRPRKKRVLDVPPPQVDVKTLSHLNPHPQPQAPAPEHLLELTAIWNEDKRTPSVLSRRAWALARNLRVEAVHRWWHRRRQTAKRAGETLLEETYELEVGIPPVLVEVVKVEEAEETKRGVARNTRGRAKRAKMEMQDSDSLVSSDTLVSSPLASWKRAYIHRSSSLPTSRSTSPLPPSSTLVSSSPVSRKRAYIHRDSSLPTSRSTSPLPPSSPPVLSSSPAPSSPPPCLQAEAQKWCIRAGDDDEEAVFTCPLCSSALDSIPLAVGANSSDPTSPPPTFIFPSPDESLTPPVIPTCWCIIGQHYALDGSFIGPCVCGPVPWGGGVFEDGLCPSSSSVEGGLCLPPSSLAEGGL